MVGSGSWEQCWEVRPGNWVRWGAERGRRVKGWVRKGGGWIRDVCDDGDVNPNPGPKKGGKNKGKRKGRPKGRVECESVETAGESQGLLL